jgi:Saxitoxin biosynthesis operon protein SxtJ
MDNTAEQGTIKSLRSFGSTVGIAFLVLGGLLYFEIDLWIISLDSNPTGGRVCGAIGLFLLLGALLYPPILKPFEKAWWALAMVLNAVMTRVILGVFYYVVMTPTGLIMRLLGRDPMTRKYKDKSESYWIARKPHEDIEAHCKRLF